MNSFEDAVIMKRHWDMISASLSNGVVTLIFAVISFAVLPIVQVSISTLMVMAVLYGIAVSRGLNHNQNMQTRLTSLRDMRYLELIAMYQPRNDETLLELSHRADIEMLEVLNERFDLISAAKNLSIYILLQLSLLSLGAWLGANWSLPILNFLTKVDAFIH